MPKYLVLAQDRTDVPVPSDAEMTAIIARYRAWTAGLRAAGALIDAEKLRDAVRYVEKADGEIRATDGPFAETREVIGGYWLIEADDEAHAVRLLADAPHLDYGRFELRQIEDLTRRG